MIAYNYHPQTGIYLGQSEADESPLEPGVFLLPAHSTFQTPPDDVDGKQIVWSGDGWKLQEIPKEPELQPPDPKPITWDDIRNDRNMRLFMSDWTQLPDVTLSEEQVTAWRTYRQELRDIAIGDGSPADVIWPTAP